MTKMVTIMLLSCCLHSPVASSGSCTPQDSLIDKGLRKVLLSNRFLEVSLPDFVNSAPDEYGFSVGFSNGLLRGLNTVRRSGHSYVSADNDGSRLNLHIAGGPVEVSYVAGFNSSFLQHSFGVAAHMATFRTSLSAEEPSPNHLRIEVYGMRMSRIRLLLNNASFSGFISDYVIDYLRPYVEAKVAQLLARELRNFAVEAFKAVRVYTASNEDEDIFAEESVLSRTWTNALGSAASYLALIRGQKPGSSRGGGNDEGVTPRRPLPERQREPRSTEVERERGVFDSCLRTLVLSRGFDPVSLPQDVRELDFSFGRVAVHEGNLTGLSSVYRSGDCALVVGECGLAVRMDLGFEDLLVSAVAVVGERSRTRTAKLDVHIPAVELSLDIAEYVVILLFMVFEMSRRATFRGFGAAYGENNDSAIRSLITCYG
ncbi:uncharacterized protein [Dermacentor albipictus]|uniref:uncharacterized protein n=1 Tax=Dermacentor albipictus TaxID=60249 RepID=UPI0038FC8168